MYTGQFVFAQGMDFLPLHEFRKCVERYQGDYKTQSFSRLDPFLCLAFAQLTSRESRRDIETCLRALHPKLYHLGFRGQVSRNNLSNANRNRDWRIDAEFAQVLIQTARHLYLHEPFGVELEQTVYALDSTTIDVCLALFPGARFRRRKGAVKRQTLLDLRASIPTFIRITTGAVHDLNILDDILPEAGSFYWVDRGYVDFARLHAFTEGCAFFVTRAKQNLQFYRRYSRPVDKNTGLRCDQTILLTGLRTAQDYPDPLRRIQYFDAENHPRLTFLTNNFALAPLTIAQLYRARWRVALFFKWIQQHLQIKAFYGTSENAVKTPIWIAVSTSVLVAILKKRLDLGLSLYNILQILSVTAFEKTPILQVLSGVDDEAPEHDSSMQLNLFNL